MEIYVVGSKILSYQIFPLMPVPPWGRNLFLCFLFFQMSWKTWLYFSFHFKHSQYLQQPSEK